MRYQVILTMECATKGDAEKAQRDIMQYTWDNNFKLYPQVKECKSIIQQSTEPTNDTL